MLLYVVMPVAIVRSYIQTFSSEMLVGFLISFAAAAASLILAMIVSTLVFRNRPSAVRQFGAAFSNAGFIGIPLVQMTLGDGAVFYVASFVAILNLLQWTYGVLIMTKDKSAISLNKLKKNPILIAFVIGMLLLYLVPGKYLTIRMAVLLAASAPVGSNVAIFAQIYHENYRNAVKDVCLSTLCSIITMPLILALAGMLW